MIPRVLVTGAGSAFAMAFLGILAEAEVEVFAADMDRYAPGLFGHRCVLPPADEQSYMSELFALVLRHRVDLIVPGCAAELPALDIVREPFEAAGIRIALAPSPMLALADDKLALAAALRGVVPTPRMWSAAGVLDGAEPPLPLRVIAPDGVWDGGLGVVISREELLRVAEAGDALFQEILIGAQFAVDVMMSHEGELRALVPRETVRGHGAVALTQRTLHDPAVERAARDVAEHLDCMPFATLRFQKDAHGIPRLLDLDVLPSSGAELVYAAGVDLPALVVADALGLATQDAGLLPFRELGAVRTRQSRVVPAAEIRAAEREPWEPLAWSSAGRVLH
ncbi:MAG: hypothetical protein GXP55_10180 [Deltaproteobacteria bacterium]|nr:hypothetical protein [Deltaproteobacteria bacterium]